MLCTRTKAALQRTRQAYRKAYDKDLAKEVASETSGVLGSNYGKMMSYALDGPEEYVRGSYTCGVPRHGLRRGRSDRIVLDAFPGTTSSRKEMLGGAER